MPLPLKSMNDERNVNRSNSTIPKHWQLMKHSFLVGVVLSADKGVTEPFKIYSHNQIAYLFIIIQSIIKRWHLKTNLKKKIKLHPTPNGKVSKKQGLLSSRSAGRNCTAHLDLSLPLCCSCHPGHQSHLSIQQVLDRITECYWTDINCAVSLLPLTFPNRKQINRRILGKLLPPWVCSRTWKFTELHIC